MCRRLSTLIRFVKDIDADEIDWLINCAGMSLPGLAEETTVKDIMAELNVNYLGRLSSIVFESESW